MAMIGTSTRLRPGSSYNRIHLAKNILLNSKQQELFFCQRITDIIPNLLRDETFHMLIW